MNKKVFNSFFKFIFFSFFFFLLFTPTVSAQKKQATEPTPNIPPPNAGINITLSPIFINLVTDPGVEAKSSFKVRNNNNFTEYFKVSINKYQLVEGVEKPVIAEVEKKDPFPSWIKFSKEKFLIIPNESKTIKFTFSPPKTAALGYYYAIVISRVKEAKGKKGRAIIAGSPAISLLAEVRSPHAKKELQFISFKSDSLFYEYLPVEFRIKVKNTGNIHIVPFGDIFIDWGRKKNLAILRANPTRGNVLPQMTRTYKVKWDDGFLVRKLKKKEGKTVYDKQGKSVYQMAWDFQKANKLRIGKYTAHLLMVYDNGKRDVPLEAKFSFWVFPWKLALIFLAIVYFVFAGFKSTFSSQIKKIKEFIKRKNAVD